MRNWSSLQDRQEVPNETKQVSGSWLKKTAVALCIYNAVCFGAFVAQSANPQRIVVYKPAVRLYPVVVTATAEATRVSTSVPTPSPVATSTETPVVPDVSDLPDWVSIQYFRYLAGIVRSEAGPITDTLTLNFLATQIWYDANSAQDPTWGNLNKRWKAGAEKYWREPKHIDYQAMSYAIVNRDAPLTQRCAYVGGIGDSEYFEGVEGTRITHIFGSGTVGVIGYNCSVRP